MRPGDDLPALSVAERDQVTAEAWAEALDISVDEAKYRVEARQRFGEILVSLNTDFAHQFAGTEVRHGGELRFVVHVVGNGSADVTKLIEAGQRDGLPIEVREGRALSLVAMNERAQAAHSVAVEELGRRSVASWVDVSTGEIVVEIGLESGELGTAVASEAERAFSDDASLKSGTVVRVSAGVVTSDEHTYGGALTTTSSTGTSGCTTAFKVQSASSTKGILTAGHCNNSRWYNMGSGNNYQMFYVTQHKGTWGDFQWHTTGHTEFDDYFETQSLRRDAWGFRSVNNMAQGDLVFGFGRVTGQVASTVNATGVTRTVGVNSYGNQVQTSTDNLTNGDSGGPWHNPGEGWGVHGGNCGSGMECFSAIDFVDEALGVTFSTS